MRDRSVKRRRLAGLSIAVPPPCCFMKSLRLNLGGYIFLQFTLLMVLGAALAQSALAQDAGPYWVIVAKSGEVQIIRSGDDAAVPAGVGKSLDAADRLVTAGGGAAVLASDNDVLRVGEDSEIEIAPKREDAGTSVILRKGSVQAKVQRRPNPPQGSFRIETDYLAATVKGTTYTVRIDSDLVAAIVAEGTVRASPVVGQRIDDDKGLDVHTGQTAVVYKARPGFVVLLGAVTPGSGESVSPPPSPPPAGGGRNTPEGSPASPHEPAKSEPGSSTGDSRF